MKEKTIKDIIENSRRNWYNKGAKSQDEQFTLSNFAKPLTGCGPFLHEEPRDRPKTVFDGKVTLHTGKAYGAWLMLPIIPPK